MNKTGFKASLIMVLCILVFFIGVCLGSKNGNTVYTISEKKVYLNDKEQTFRDSDGHRLDVVEINGNVYIPFTDRGLFLGNSSSVDEDGVHLEQKDTDEIDSVVINTITIDGVPFTNDDLLGNKYIMFLNWATWCPDCDNFINNLYLNSEQIKESDIRVIGLPYYDESTDLRELSKEVNKVLKQNTVEFTNIVCTKEMSEFFQTSIDNIPSVIIMDNKGHVIAKDSTELISIQDLLNAVEEYSSCNEC